MTKKERFFSELCELVRRTVTVDLDKNALKSDPKNLSVNTLFEFVMKRHLKKDLLRNNFKLELKM